MAGNPDSGPVIKTLTATTTSGASVSTQSFSFDTTGATHAAMGWVSKSLAFNAEGPTTVTFASTTEGCWGPALDNVVVTDDPSPVVSEAPSSILLPGSAIVVAGLGFVGFRFFRRKTAA